MSDFLARLAERQLTPSPGVTPRLPSRFAPVAPVDEVSPFVPATTAAVEQPVSQVRHGVRTLEERPVALPLSDEAAAPEPQVAREHETQKREGHVAAPPPVLVRPESSTPPLLPPISQVVERQVPPDQVASDAPRAEASRAEVVHHHRAVERTSLEVRAVPVPAPLVPPRSATLDAIASPAPHHAIEPGDGPPIVNVTIGRIEVRAIVPPPAKERRAADARKAMSLEEYLERRHGGRP